MVETGHRPKRRAMVSRASRAVAVPLDCPPFDQRAFDGQTVGLSGYGESGVTNETLVGPGTAYYQVIVLDYAYNFSYPKP